MKKKYIEQGRFLLSTQEKPKIKPTRSTRKPRHPRAIERSYDIALRKYVDNLFSSVDNLLLGGTRSDGVLEDLSNGLIDNVDDFVYGVSISIEDAQQSFIESKTIETTAGAIQQFNVKDAFAQEKNIIGIGLNISEDIFNETAELWVRQNVSLAKSLSNDVATGIEGVVMRGMADGLSSREIAKQILSKIDLEPLNSVGGQSKQSLLQKTKKRATLIAVDQTAKLNAQLTRKRHEEIGIDSYEWLNSSDLRVRGNKAGLYPNSEYDHWSRDHKIYKWSEPPMDGHAGIPIRCRCVAGANFEEYDDIFE